MVTLHHRVHGVYFSEVHKVFMLRRAAALCVTLCKHFVQLCGITLDCIASVKIVMHKLSQQYD